MCDENIWCQDWMIDVHVLYTERISWADARCFYSCHSMSSGRFGLWPGREHTASNCLIHPALKTVTLLSRTQGTENSCLFVSELPSRLLTRGDPRLSGGLRHSLAIHLPFLHQPTGLPKRMSHLPSLLLIPGDHFPRKSQD